MWIVELEKGVYIAEGKFVTLDKDIAKIFKTESAAKAELTKMRKYRQMEFKNANIYQVEQ